MYLQQFENTRAKADVYLRRAPNYTKIREIRENPPTWLCQDSGRVSKISICAFNLSRVALRETYTQHSKIFTCIFLNSLKLYFEFFYFFRWCFFLFFSKPKKVLRYRCYWIKIKYNLCFDWFMYNILINII